MTTRKARAAASAVVFILSMAGLARADVKPPVKMPLLQPATVGGTELAPGAYAISWTQTGADVKVTFARGKKVVAETTGKLVEREKPSSYGAIVTRRDGAGKDVVSEILFESSKRAIVLQGS
jgi:hypothetical protein